MRRAVLFGKPLKRRHSVAMHDAAFEAFGVDARYELAEVDENQLREMVPLARQERWLGFQITAPHKRAIMPLLDEVEDAAEEIGAVNSVEVTADGRLVGFNTDTVGFITALTTGLGFEIKGSKVVIAGAGGVGHAVVHGILSNGASDVTVLDLDVRDVERLGEEFASVGKIEPMAFRDARVPERLGAADLFVNATSVGMLSKGPVIPVSQLRSDACVFDVVYIPAETELVRQARAAGMRAMNGGEMLVAQAAVAFMRWTGLSDPTEVMRAAVIPLLEAEIAGP